jgi:hypothetical protein
MTAGLPPLHTDGVSAEFNGATGRFSTGDGDDDRRPSIVCPLDPAVRMTAGKRHDGRTGFECGVENRIGVVGLCVRVDDEVHRKRVVGSFSGC